jgi:hypothetical protein
MGGFAIVEALLLPRALLNGDHPPAGIAAPLSDEDAHGLLQ